MLEKILVVVQTKHAPIALKAAGVAAVVAPSFARIFYRNAFNMGLPIFELPESLEIKEGEEISIDLDIRKIVPKQGLDEQRIARQAVHRAHRRGTQPVIVMVEQRRLDTAVGQGATVAKLEPHRGARPGVSGGRRQGAPDDKRARRGDSGSAPAPHWR